MRLIKTRIFGAVLLVLCLLIIGSTAASAWVYPVAQLSSYDPDTFTYVYTVSVSSTDSFPFGHFRVYATVPNEGATAGWIARGPEVNGQIASGWISSISRWDADVPCDYVDWQASTVAEVRKGASWTGTFTLVAPNTQPVEGWIYTSDGPGSEHTLWNWVPGEAPSVPEPSSLVGLLTGSVALLGLRKRKSN